MVSGRRPLPSGFRRTLWQRKLLYLGYLPSSHTFTADGANFTVFCKQSDEKNPSVFLDVPFKAGS